MALIDDLRTHRTGPGKTGELLDVAAARIAELEATLRTVRAAIVEKAEDTFWLTPIETVVDHIDAVLGDYADAQAELSI